jgi:RNA polymerase sigma-70 factor, ECF subfamily
VNHSNVNTPDESPFDRLYAAHAARIYRFCLRLCGGCAAEAEDLAQESLVAAFQGQPRLRNPVALTAYLYRAAVLGWRKRRKQRERESEALFPAATNLPDGTLTRLTRLHLQQAIATLPEELREAFILVKAEGLTHREAARLLDLPLGTVQWRVHEAVRRLRTVLAEDDTFGETQEG